MRIPRYVFTIIETFTCFRADFLGSIPLPPILIVVVAVDDPVICEGPIRDPPPCISGKERRPELDKGPENGKNDRVIRYGDFNFLNWQPCHFP